MEVAPCFTAISCRRLYRFQTILHPGRPENEPGHAMRGLVAERMGLRMARGLGVLLATPSSQHQASQTDRA